MSNIPDPLDKKSVEMVWSPLSGGETISHPLQEEAEMKKYSKPKTRKVDSGAVLASLV
jgi:hypothetical protein